MAVNLAARSTLRNLAAASLSMRHESFALASGTRAVNTAARLEESARAAGLQPEEIVAVDAAFSHILRLRLNYQLAEGASEASHGIPLESLHDVDRAILKASLQQARRLQTATQVKLWTLKN